MKLFSIFQKLLWIDTGANPLIYPKVALVIYKCVNFISNLIIATED